MSTELSDAFSPGKTRELAERYWQLKSARLVTSDGEIIDAKDAEAEMAGLRKILMARIEKDGPFVIEGAGEFRIQERDASEIDVKALRKGQPFIFDEMCERGILSVNKARLKANKDLTGYGQYVMPGHSQALVIERKE